MSSAKPAQFAVPPIEKSILVRCDPARAFQAFTAELGQWWPLQMFSVTQAFIEPKEGGRIYETAEDGSMHDWGRVLSWSPPSGFSMTWHPGRPADPHTVVELSFAPEGSATRVRLVHRGWEALGKDGPATRGRYDGGWDKVLGQAFAGHLAAG
jgi:Activator of Hsp90 ATPase homolog 1-like protein